MTRRFLVALVLLLAVSLPLHAQVTSDRLQNAAREARNWWIYSGG